MTRMPVVARVLKERLGLDARQHEPDLAVAKGAALYALMRTAPRPAGAVRTGGGPAGCRAGSPRQRPESRGRGARGAAAGRGAGRHVVPRGFGVKSLDGSDPLALTDPMRARQIIVHLLPANTALPADTGPFTFLTAIDNQRMVEHRGVGAGGPDGIGGPGREPQDRQRAC